MNELGFYDLHNDYSVNIDAPLSDVSSTTIHEITHMFITLQSGYGIFMRMLKRGDELYSKYNYVFHFFLKHMIKMQEACSTFAELLFTYVLEKKDSLKQGLEDLKFNNKKYYNYTYPLFFLFSYLDESLAVQKGYKFIIPLNDAIPFFVDVALESLNIDLSLRYNVDILKNKKILYKTENDASFANNCFPNKRFYKSIHKLGVELHKISNKEYSADHFNAIKNDVFKSVYNKEYAQSIKSSDYLDAYIKNYLVLIGELYKDSPDFYIIYKNISSITLKKVDISRLPAYSLPAISNKMYNRSNELVTQLSDFNDKDVCLIFINGEDDTIHKSMDGFSRAIDLAKHKSNGIISKSKEMSFLCDTFGITRLFQMLHIAPGIVNLIGFSYIRKEMYCGFINENELANIANDYIIAVNYKYYEKFDNINKSEYAIYYYCDRTYNNAVPIINEFATENTLKYKFIQYEKSLSVLIIQIKKNTYFVLPIITSAILVIKNDILTQKLKIKIENEIENAQDILKDIDVVINCLYFTNSKNE